MKAIINLADTIHDFKKTNLYSNKDGSDDYRCKNCGLTGKRKSLGPSLHVSGEKTLIENCTVKTKTQDHEINTLDDKVPGNETLEIPVNTTEVEAQDMAIDSFESKASGDDILEHAVSLFNEEQAKISLSERDKIMQDIGSIKTLQFNESLSRYMKAQKLNKLLTGKAYKELCLNNSDEVFALLGIKPTIGRQLIRNIRALTDDGYKALTSINMKQKDINLLAKARASIEKEGKEVFVTVAGNKINAHDTEELQTVLKKIEGENKGFQNKIKTLENAYLEYAKENTALRGKLDEYTQPDKALVNALNVTNEVQTSFNVLMNRLQKLLEKNNPEIKYKVLETLSHMDNGFSSLHHFINDEEQAEVGTPEDMIKNYGSDEN